MRIHFTGAGELHTNTTHSENQLLSLSYLLSVRNGPMHNTSEAVTETLQWKGKYNAVTKS